MPSCPSTPIKNQNLFSEVVPQAPKRAKSKGLQKEPISVRFLDFESDLENDSYDEKPICRKSTPVKQKILTHVDRNNPEKNICAEIVAPVRPDRISNQSMRDSGASVPVLRDLSKSTNASSANNEPARVNFLVDELLKAPHRPEIGHFNGSLRSVGAEMPMWRDLHSLGQQQNGVTNKNTSGLNQLLYAPFRPSIAHSNGSLRSLDAPIPKCNIGVGSPFDAVTYQNTSRLNQLLYAPFRPSIAHSNGSLRSHDASIPKFKDMFNVRGRFQVYEEPEKMDVATEQSSPFAAISQGLRVRDNQALSMNDWGKFSTCSSAESYSEPMDTSDSEAEPMDQSVDSAFVNDSMEVDQEYDIVAMDVDEHFHVMDDNFMQ